MALLVGILIQYLPAEKSTYFRIRTIFSRILSHDKFDFSEGCIVARAVQEMK